MNIAQLVQSTKKLRKITRATNGKFFVKKYNKKTKELLVQCTFAGESEPGTHTPKIVFQEIEFSKSKSPGFPIPFKSKTGYIYLQRPKRTADVKVSCRCSDYRFTWFFYNDKRNAHYGPGFPPYERVTDTYPERNPLHVPGICKHILGLADLARDKGIIN